MSAWLTEQRGYQLKRPSSVRPGLLSEQALARTIRFLWPQRREPGPPPDGSERSVVLDFYQDPIGTTKWNWKDLETDEASQEFDSEEEGMEAWRNDQLEWSRLADQG